MDRVFNDVFEVPVSVEPYIHLIVTPQEERLVLLLADKPGTLEEIASGLGISLQEAEELTGAAYHRAVINKDQENSGFYRTATLYDRLGYFTQYEQEIWQSISKEDRAAIDDWYIGDFASRVKTQIDAEGDGFHRDDVLPIREALRVLAQAEEKAGKPYYVVPCNCRTTTNACHFSVDTCISNRYGPNSQWDRGYGRRLTWQELNELMLALDKEGLMHTVAPSGHACNCETCCCYEFRAALKLGTKGRYPRVLYVAELAQDKCVSCGICVKRCHFQAFSRDLQTRRVGFHPEKCWGCGICEATCPKGAIHMAELRA